MKIGLLIHRVEVKISMTMVKGFWVKDVTRGF